MWSVCRWNHLSGKQDDPYGWEKCTFSLGWNMVINGVENVNFLQIIRNCWKKKTEISIWWCISPQNCKDFPPKVQFPGNFIPKCFPCMIFYLFLLTRRASLFMVIVTILFYDHWFWRESRQHFVILWTPLIMAGKVEWYTHRHKVPLYYNVSLSYVT